MATKVKKLNKGIGRYRGGRASRTGKKLKIRKFQIKPAPGIKQVTFEAEVSSEFPSQRRRQAADVRSKIGKKTSKNPRGRYSYDGKSMPAAKYKVQIAYQDVEFSPEKSDKFSIPVTVAGKEQYMRPPNADNGKVKVKCVCSDFRYAWEWYNAKKEKGLIGQPRQYKRVTQTREGDPKDLSTYQRPKNPKNPNPHGHDFVNPRGYVGYCKHIFNLLRFLREEDFVR